MSTKFGYSEQTPNERSRKLLLQRASRQHIVKMYQRMALRNSAENGQLARQVRHLDKSQEQWLMNHDAGVRLFKLERRRALMSAPPRLSAAAPAAATAALPLALDRGADDVESDADEGDGERGASASPPSHTPPPPLQAPHADPDDGVALTSAFGPGRLALAAGISSLGPLPPPGPSFRASRRLATRASELGERRRESAPRAAALSAAAHVSPPPARGGGRLSPLLLHGNLPPFLALTDTEMSQLRKERLACAIEAAKRTHEGTVRACDEKLRRWMRVHAP